MGIDNKNGDGNDEVPENSDCKVLPFTRKKKDPDKIEEIRDNSLRSLTSGFGKNPFGLHTMDPSQSPDLCPPEWEGLSSEQIDKLLLRKLLREKGELNTRKFDKWATANHLAQEILKNTEIRELTKKEIAGTESLFEKRVYLGKVDDNFLFGQLEKFASSEKERRSRPFDAFACAREVKRRYDEIVDRIKSEKFSG